MRIYRLHRSWRPPNDFYGSLIISGRWHTAGTPVLYCSTTLALACLEILVHTDKTQIPNDYVYSFVDLSLTPGVLEHSGGMFDVRLTRRIGNDWLAQGQLATLAPSVVIPPEFNVLLNPEARSFTSLSWSSPEFFGFDPRLF